MLSAPTLCIGNAISINARIVIAENILVKDLFILLSSIRFDIVKMRLEGSGMGVNFGFHERQAPPTESLTYNPRSINLPPPHPF
jgi:hypothetical protein